MFKSRHLDDNYHKIAPMPILSVNDQRLSVSVRKTLRTLHALHFDRAETGYDTTIQHLHDNGLSVGNLGELLQTPPPRSAADIPLPRTILRKYVEGRFGAEADKVGFVLHFDLTD